MSFNYYVEKYKDGEYVDRAPRPLTRDEAEDLVKMAKEIEWSQSWKISKSSFKE